MRLVRRHFKPRRTGGFDSGAEAKRHGKLRLLEMAGEIRNLEVKPRVPLVVNGRKIGRGWLSLDFKYEEYVDGAWRTVLEDCKSVDTRESKLRRELAEAIHNIHIKVVQT